MAMFTPHEAPAKDLAALPLPRPDRPIGRDNALKEIYGYMRANTPVLIYGEPGMGKSSLAGALASVYTQQPGGVLWLTGDTTPLSSLLVRIGRALDEREISNSDQPSGTAGAVAAALGLSKPFIVLDDVSDALVVQQFLDKCAGGLPVLIVSETALSGSWQTVQLTPLADADALGLFKAKAGIAEARYDAEIAAIARALQNRPYALALAARAMVAAKQTPTEFAGVVAGVARTTNGHPDMTAVAVSYRALNNALQGLILMLGATFRGEASVELLSMASGVNAETIEQAVGILSQLYLVEKFTRYGQPYYRLHSLVADYARQTLRGSNRLDSLQARVKDTVMQYIERYTTSGAVNHDRIAAEMDTIIATAEWASAQGDKTVAARIVTILLRANDFFKERGYLHDLLSLRDLSSGSTSAFPAYGEVRVASAALEDDETLDDLDDDLYDDTAFDDHDIDDENLEDVEDDVVTFSQRFQTTSPGDAEEDDDDEALSENADSWLDAPVAAPLRVMPVSTTRADILSSTSTDELRAALAQAKQTRDFARQVEILSALGKLQVSQDKPTEAITTYNDILSVQESLSDEDGIIDTLDMLSSLLVKTGSSQAAILHANRGAQLARTADHLDARMNMLLTIGDARQDLGESDAAVSAFSDALELARNNDDKQHEAIALYKLGYASLDSGDADEAIRTWEQAREMFKVQLKRDYEGRVLGGLGTAYAEQQHWSEAIRYFRAALYIAREVKDREEEALQMSNLGQAQVEAGQMPEALISYRQALHLAYLNDDRDEIVTAIVDLVRLMLRSNRLLGICQLLIQDAENLEPNDRDVIGLSQQIDDKLTQAGAKGIVQTPVVGTARDYAANAYALLEA